MPLYEYQCNACGTVTEVMQRMSDPPLTTCEECGGELRKLISAPAFQFKGSGWYVTDYAGKGDGAKKSSDKDSDSASADSKDSKTGSGDSSGSNSGSSKASKSSGSSEGSSSKTETKKTSSG